jgi:hypothetical protein
LIFLRIEQTHKINRVSKENKNKIIKYTNPCSLSYGSENWTIKATEARRITTETKKNYTGK